MNRSRSMVNKSGWKAAYVVRAGLVLVAGFVFALASSQRTIVLANTYHAQNNESAAIEQSKNSRPNNSEVQQEKLAQQRGEASLADDLPTGPTSKNCYSAMFHAASDCDRLASQMVLPNTGTEGVKNLSQRFREADDASWNAWPLYKESR